MNSFPRASINSGLRFWRFDCDCDWEKSWRAWAREEAVRRRKGEAFRRRMLGGAVESYAGWTKWREGLRMPEVRRERRGW